MFHSDAHAGAGGCECAPVLPSPWMHWSFLQDAVAVLWSGALLREDGAKEKMFVADQVWDFSQDSGLACLLSHVNQLW